MKKKFNVKTYLAIACCMILQFAGAQTDGPPAKAAAKETKESPTTKEYKWSVGPVIGFKSIKSVLINDIGVEASRTIRKGERAHLELSYRSASSNYEQNWGRIPMNMKTDIGSLLIGAGYDWFPFVRFGSDSDILKSLKVSGGAWYVNKPNYDFTASLRDPLTWGQLTFTPEQIGLVSTAIKTNKVQPYLGLGYDQFYMGKNINFSINGGCLYQGKPEVTMMATNMLKPTEESAARLEHNLSSYQFIPFVQLHIQYNLN